MFWEIPFKTWKAPLLNEQQIKPVVPFTQTLQIFTPSRMVGMVTFSKSEDNKVFCFDAFEQWRLKNIIEKFKWKQ